MTDYCKILADIIEKEKMLGQYASSEIPILVIIQESHEQGKKDALKGILVFMRHKSRLEIPTVQDNWIDTIRFIEKELGADKSI